MPSTFMGWGSEFRGKRDFHADGSYVTTEWVVVFGLPLFPLCSLRIKEGRYTTSALGSKEEYIVCKELSLSLKQVACVYAFTLFHLAWFVCVLVLVGTHLTQSTPLGVFLLITVGACLPLAIPGMFRRRSKRKAGIAFVPPSGHEVLDWWRRSTWKEKAAVLVPLVGLLVAVIAGFLLSVYT